MNDPTKVISIADKVVTMAEGALAGLDRVIVDWPAEFRAIMWEAVADIATRRAEAAHASVAVSAHLGRRS
jgi:F420-0:gamma-glutamyl ligase